MSAIKCKMADSYFDNMALIHKTNFTLLNKKIDIFIYKLFPHKIENLSFNAAVVEIITCDVANSVENYFKSKVFLMMSVCLFILNVL